MTAGASVLPGTAMVFAAGRGTRMRHLTHDRPKPMIPVAGRPLIDHALERLREARVPRAIVNTHYCPDPLRAHLATVDDPGIVLSHEETLLETGGGLKAALPLIGGPDEAVLTLNADAVWSGPPPLVALGQAWDPARMDALLLCVGTSQARGHQGAGDFFPDGEAAAEGPAPLRRRGAAASAPLVYTGAQIIKPGGLAAIAQSAFSLNLLWDRMLSEGRLFGLTWPGVWVDVGQPESLALAEEALR